MQGTACRLHHFGVVEVPDAQKNRHLETDGRMVDLKRDPNLRILPAVRSCLDASHRDLVFAHPITQIARADPCRSKTPWSNVARRPPRADTRISCSVLILDSCVSMVQRAVASRQQHEPEKLQPFRTRSCD